MDVLHDNSHRTWIQLGDAHENLIPGYVMDYTLPSKEAASEIDTDLFADSARRLFPVDSAASTWLSAAYFQKHALKGELPYGKEELAYIDNVIKTAAGIYEIEADITKIAEVLLPMEEKQAEDDDANYGWVMRDGKTGETVARKYPMFDSRGVKKASSYFNTYRNHYPLGIRRKIARNIMTKASEYGVAYTDLDSGVLKEAGYGLPRKDILMDEIYERAHLTKDAEAAIALANVNELVSALSAKEVGENLDKIAEVIDEFDRSADLTRFYGDKIMMPADFLFDIDLKTASVAVEAAVELNQFVFSLDKLAELPVDVYGDILGEEFVKAIVKIGEGAAEVDREKLADNLFSLPQPDKTALEEHLAGLFN